MELIYFVFCPKNEVCRPLVLRKRVRFFLTKDGMETGGGRGSEVDVSQSSTHCQKDRHFLVAWCFFFLSKRKLDLLQVRREGAEGNVFTSQNAEAATQWEKQQSS